MNMNPKKTNVSHLFSRYHNCVVGELGVEGRRGQPQPSAGFLFIYEEAHKLFFHFHILWLLWSFDQPQIGFAAIYVMAHELGHNLGMLHDDKAGCSRDGFIMSPTRYDHHTVWSPGMIMSFQQREHWRDGVVKVQRQSGQHGRWPRVFADGGKSSFGWAWTRW